MQYKAHSLLIIKLKLFPDQVASKLASILPPNFLLTPSFSTIGSTRSHSLGLTLLQLYLLIIYLTVCIFPHFLNLFLMFLLHLYRSESKLKLDHFMSGNCKILFSEHQRSVLSFSIQDITNKFIFLAHFTVSFKSLSIKHN